MASKNVKKKLDACNHPNPNAGKNSNGTHTDSMLTAQIYRRISDKNVILTCFFLNILLTNLRRGLRK